MPGGRAASMILFNPVWMIPGALTSRRGVPVESSPPTIDRRITGTRNRIDEAVRKRCRISTGNVRIFGDLELMFLTLKHDAN